MILYKKIINYLNTNQIKYEVISHHKVYTSIEASKVRKGLTLHNGVKSILIKYLYNKSPNYALFVSPGDLKLFNKSIKLILNCKEFNFATPNEVKNISGVEIGAVPPYSFLYNKIIPIYLDAKAFDDVVTIAFNPGLHDKTIIMTKYQFIKSLKGNFISENFSNLVK